MRAKWELHKWGTSQGQEELKEEWLCAALVLDLYKKGTIRGCLGFTKLRDSQESIYLFFLIFVKLRR